MNVLERETVGCFRIKLAEKVEQIAELKRKLYGEGYKDGDSGKVAEEPEEEKEEEIFVNPLEGMIT